MPKLKSHSGAKKRFFKTAGGKWRHKRAGARHILTPSTSSQKRFKRGKNELNLTDSKTMAKYLPYA